jgi:hypothetical protein
VGEGRRLVETTPFDRWALGDLLLEAIPEGGTRDERGAAQVELANFCAEIGLAFSTGKDLRYTAAAWPPKSRFADVSYAKHSRYRSRPDRLMLLLNDETDENIRGKRELEHVLRAEQLLADPKIRRHLERRSRERKAKLMRVVSALDSEELAARRREEKLEEEQLRAQRLAGKEAERFLDAIKLVSHMVTDLVGMKEVAELCPAQLKDPFIDRLEQITKVAAQVIDKVSPPARSPQPRTVIDVSVVDHTGAEHRTAGLPRGTGESA